MMRRHLSMEATLIAALLAMILSGCGRITTDYGISKGRTGRISLNGFGALRSAYQNSGYRNRDVSRLSERVMRTHVIVWTPQALGSVDNKVTRWFERWLARGDRTLVYIVPDSGSEADYWIDAAKLAPPEQRLEYRKRAAQSINQRMLWRLNRNTVQSNGWFNIETLSKRQTVGQPSGAWDKELGDVPPEQPISVEFLVTPYDPDDKANQTTTAAAAGFNVRGPTGPSSPGFALPAETTPSRIKTSSSNLVRTEGGDPIVIQIRSKRWRNSSIIVVAGGSLLTNYSFSRPWNRRLAQRIIDESTPTTNNQLRAGFMTTGWQPVSVSETKPGVPKASGMELLTVWPMSLVTMHGVMLGLVVCLMLFPIFGRPKRIRRTEENHFGHHLDAVAALMNKSGGEPYARKRISEYMKRMHGETVGPWVLPDEPSAKTEKPLPKLTAKRFAATRGKPEQQTTESNQTEEQNDDGDVFGGNDDLSPIDESNENQSSENQSTESSIPVTESPQPATTQSGPGDEQDDVFRGMDDLSPTDDSNENQSTEQNQPTDKPKKSENDEA